MLLDPIGSQYIRAISVTRFVYLFISPHMLRTRYKQILLNPLILSAPLENNDNKDDQDNQDDQDDQDDLDGQDD